MGAALSSSAKDALLKKISGLNDENRKLLDDELDTYTVLVAAKIPHDILKGTASKIYDDSYVKTEESDLGWSKGYLSGQWYKIPPVAEDVVIEHRTAKLSIPVLTDDDFHGTPPLATLELLKTPTVFPLSDKFYSLQSDQEAETLLDQMRLLPVDGQANPNPYHTWEEMTSDQAMSRLFFHGIGAVLMHNQSATPHEHQELGPFMVDMNLARLEVRKGYAKYGSRLHFDANQNITAIFDYGSEKLVKPDQGEAWEKAKQVAKQTTILLITVREHLLWDHLLLANTMTRVKTQELPPSHPLRRLLTVFTFRTSYVNMRAYRTLVPELSIIHRASALTVESINKLFLIGYTQSNIFQPFPQQPIGEELKKLSEEGKFPYHSEGVAWFEIVHAFVTEWIDKAGDSSLEDSYAKKFFQGVEAATRGQRYKVHAESREAKINSLAQMIWGVTAFHEIVGTIVDYTRLPSFMGLRALEDISKTSTDLQSFVLFSVLTASTAIRMPMLVGKFDKYFGKGGAPSWETEVWANFQAAIQEQSKKVQAADAERTTEFKTFDPAKFECSVSV